MRSSWISDIQDCLGFYSRLPMPLVGNRNSMPDFSRTSWAAPLAGGVIGVIAAAFLVALSLMGVASPLVAVMTVCAQVLMTGALHEDGLADFADSFGSFSRERKLEIMRDSRVGTYGVLALVLSVLLRIGAILGALSHGVGLAAVVIVSSAATSRAFGLIPLFALPPARKDGAGASASSPTLATMRQALVIGCLFGLAPVLGGSSFGQTLVSILAALGGAIAVSKTADRQIGGYTGDVLGAAQQTAEIVALICLSV